MDYLIVKWLHVLSSTLLFGTGLGSAFHMFFASLSRDAAAAARVVRQVIWADWLFTTTTIVLQPLTGLYLVHRLQLPLSTPWIAWTFVLYAIAGACWIPVVVMQIRMHRLAAAAAACGGELPPAYWRMLRWWTALGVPAFFALVVVFWLMVAKPS